MGGGQGGCERRIEAFEKIHTKHFGGGGGGVRVDENEKLKFLRKFTKTFWRGRGAGWWGDQGGCERNVWGRG